MRNLLAYRKVGVEGVTEELWVPPTVFDKEFVGGVNKAELMKELQEQGWLLPSASDGRPTLERRVNGKKARYFIRGREDCTSVLIFDHQTVSVPSIVR